MNFLEFLCSFIFGMFIGIVSFAIMFDDKVITIKELNECGYNYNKYSQVINGVETNWVEIVKR